MRMHWIIVCEHFHGAVGPMPTEQLAAELAAYASEIGECTYRPVRLELAMGPGAYDEEKNSFKAGPRTVGSTSCP